MIKQFLLITILFTACKATFSENIADTIYLLNNLENHCIAYSDSLHSSTKELRKKKIVAALSAFPFPLGFMGTHRLILGTKPWVPVVYVATFGGVFGLLPLIDFCVIVFSKDIEQYENSPHVFMWVK